MISVVLATKNGSKYIIRALDSVLKQVDVDLEIIVVSDGSTDETVAIVRDYMAEHGMVPFRLIELSQNIGPGLARNLAILGGEAEGKTYPECSGEYVAIIDDDDMWLNEQKLKNQLALLESDRGLALVGSQKTEFIREDGTHIYWLNNETDPEAIRISMLLQNPVVSSSVLFRKDIFKNLGGYKKMHLAEDYDLWLRIGQIGKISNAADAEVKYTIRAGSASKEKRLAMAKIFIKLIFEYRNSYPGFLKAIIKAYLRTISDFIFLSKTFRSLLSKLPQKPLEFLFARFPAFVLRSWFTRM